MGCVPRASELVVKVAVPVASSVTVAMIVPLSLKLTVPVGTAGPLTTVMKVTEVPLGDGLREEAMLSVGVAWVTVCVRLALLLV